MQKKQYFILLALLFIFNACKKEDNFTFINHEALNPINADTNAGTWLPILLTSPTEFSIPVPMLTNNPNYILETQAIKSRQNKKSKKDEKIIKYWSSGSVLRWNEIARELVAKYNLPPYQNPDGTYPIPNPANPFAYPTFPFSNPPYAARAYAYLTAAQYDALIAAYYYKSLFQRPNPKVSNNTIEELIKVTQGYCYPSEDAVIAGASLAILSMMFPTEQAYLQDMATQSMDYRLLVGGNTSSDLAAGFQLGKDVAGKFISRARTDKAGGAIGNASVLAQFKQNAIARGDVPWQSLESPSRPGLLPLFGQVKGFLLDSLEVVNARPGPPPIVGSAQHTKELDEVLKYSKNATVENMRIVRYWESGIGTYTPPGQWNAIAANDFVKERYSEPRWARNYALLNLAMFQAVICCWETKYYYFNARPSQINAEIKTLAGMPNFPSYTSGHSTFDGSASNVLIHLLPKNSGKYIALANQGSESRLIGAIHYRSDIEVGLAIGNKIAEKAVDRAKIDGAE